MKQARISELSAQYRKTLMDDILPFWLRHGLDREQGGFLHWLDRDGSVYNTDKNLWVQCRSGVWIAAKLYNEAVHGKLRGIAPRQEWLEAAGSTMEFVLAHAFDEDGRMFFTVTREGQPLRKRRYLFSESFGVIACTEYYKSTGDARYLEQACQIYRLMLDYYRTPGALPPKVDPRTRQMRSHAMPMVLIGATHEIRQVHNDSLYAEVVEDALDQVLHQFWKPEDRVLLENVGPHGERLDSPEGRVINPGHAIESAWFIMREAEQRGDKALLQAALEILDAMLERGWDPLYGGILYFLDVEGRPPDQLEWDQKLWWPHVEALYATLYAHHLTGEPKYLDWFERIHAWTFGHFPDPEYGEWYGYLHRDGSVLLPLKGNNWKGFFHIPRALILSLQLLDRMVPDGDAT